MTVGRSSYALRKHELYETETWAVRALLRCFPVLPGSTVWEPAAGNHAIADVLLEQGAKVVTSDITVHRRLHHQYGDFLGNQVVPMHHSIITNPPYGAANRLARLFVERALEHCDGMVAMLLTSKFDFGKTRTHLFKDCPRFAGKVALLDRVSWLGNGEGGTEDHAWYVWNNAAAVTAPRMFWIDKLEANR